MQPTPLCPYCRRRPVDPAWQPFCSERCKLVDLGKWLSEEYKISEPLDEAQNQPPPPQHRGRDDE